MTMKSFEEYLAEDFPAFLEKKKGKKKDGEEAKDGDDKDKDKKD